MFLFNFLFTDEQVVISFLREHSTDILQSMMLDYSFLLVNKES